MSSVWVSVWRNSLDAQTKLWIAWEILSKLYRNEGEGRHTERKVHHIWTLLFSACRDSQPLFRIGMVKSTTTCCTLQPKSGGNYWLQTLKFQRKGLVAQPRSGITLKRNEGVVWIKGRMPKTPLSWGDGSAIKVLATQARGPEFRSPKPTQDFPP